ncbi:hypothetical protein RJ640_023919 [Escallonia rubra]|uniref:Uncharacterized protein n=1 Tax=Escallonia rubra TaxID=112253 RepID=A0AA88QEB9_9ASTE|nr:hypothetical protein RJ640_023919 [Escallonia rubra]
MAKCDIYTKDGTVGMDKKPVLKKKAGSWKACRFILGTECCERLASYGMGANLVTISSNVSTQQTYRTIAHFSMAYVGGMTLLTLSASVKELKAPQNVRIAAFYSVVYLIAMNSFFNWFYLSINVRVLIAASVLVWMQMNMGWSCGFRVPTVAMAITVPYFFSDRRLYQLHEAGGSPLTRILQIPAASLFLYNTPNVIFSAPVCNRMIVRVAKKFTGHQGGFTWLQQMGIGLVTSTFAMISARMLEVVRLKTVGRNNYFGMRNISHVSTLASPSLFSPWLRRSLHMEFFYDQASDAMRSPPSIL